MRIAGVVAVLIGCAPAQPRADATLGASGLEATSAVATGDASSGSGDASSSDASASSSSSSSGESSSTGEVPPFQCTPEAASSPVLAADVWFDPAQPHPGDTVNVIVRAGNGLASADAPPMQLQAQHGGGTTMLDPTMRAGGAALYYYAIADVPLGDVCVLGLIDGAPEVSASVTVTPRPPARAGDVFKVIENHQWTCDEQPDFGNELHLWVRDEDGVGIPGATIRVAPADSTDVATIYNGDSSTIPTTLVTDGDGYVKEYDYWPISDHGLLVLELSVDGAASDIATEITTGWWETDDDGCRYCDAASPKNVWGHWSHSVVFQRDPSATELCRVPVDHAGQAACGPPGHVLHDPDHVACWSIE